MDPSEPTRAARLAALRAEIAALADRPCGMVHEAVRLAPDGLPEPDPGTGGARRPSLCPAPIRRAHLGCTHTTARLLLRRALDALGEHAGEAERLRAELGAIDARLGDLDHRRYAAESRRAEALRAGDAGGIARAQVEIGASVAEHRALGRRVDTIRGAILRRLDRAGPRSSPSDAARRPA